MTTTHVLLTLGGLIVVGLSLAALGATIDACLRKRAERGQ